MMRRDTTPESPPFRIPRYPARKSAVGEALIWLLVRSALRHMFVRVRLHVADDPRGAGIPLIAVANHPSWWDGYLALLLSRHFRLPRYLMMDAAQLRRYGFFAWAGCFGVERDDPRDVGRAIVYAARLLATRRNALLWMFPQGGIVPVDARPLVVQGGVAQIVRRATRIVSAVGVIPVAWQLVFRGEQHPEVFIRTGPIARFDANSGWDAQAVSDVARDVLAATMDTLQDDIREERFASYRVILRGQRGINDRFDGLLRRTRLVRDP